MKAEVRDLGLEKVGDHCSSATRRLTSFAFLEAIGWICGVFMKYSYLTV